jgi:hypothetical protein
MSIFMRETELVRAIPTSTHWGKLYILLVPAADTFLLNEVDGCRREKRSRKAETIDRSVR